MFAGSPITQGADTQLTLIFDQNSSYEVRDARNKQLKKGNIEDDYHDAHGNKITRVIKVRIPSGISPFTVIVSHPDAVKFHYDGNEYQAPGKRFQIPESERTTTPTIAQVELAVSIKVQKLASARPKAIIDFQVDISNLNLDLQSYFSTNPSMNLVVVDNYAYDNSIAYSVSPYTDSWSGYSYSALNRTHIRKITYTLESISFFLQAIATPIPRPRPIPRLPFENSIPIERFITGCPSNLLPVFSKLNNSSLSKYPKRFSS